VQRSTSPPTDCEKSPAAPDQAVLLTSGANDGEASPSAGDASPNGDGASPSDGHVPIALLEAGAVRPHHPLSRLGRHFLYFQLAAEEAAERLAQSRQAQSHRQQIQQPVSETVGVPWCPLAPYRTGCGKSFAAAIRPFNNSMAAQFVPASREGST
jgi:hypothetical protein